MNAMSLAGAEMRGPPVKIDPLGRMTRRDAALALGKSEQTLANWKTAGRGPPCLVIDGRCYYDAAEIIRYGRGEAA
jgi:hypothetical protein